MPARTKLLLALPAILAFGGIAWMAIAVSHFERSTGRSFHGLAGYHFTMPQDGFAYHPDGARIHRWTTTIPANTTFTLLALSLLLALLRERHSGRFVLIAISGSHVVSAMAFLLVASWHHFNVTGVFI